MANSIRQDFHTDLAALISTEIQYQRSNYYYFLGKVDTWGIGDTVPLTMQADSNLENTRIRSNTLYIKKITPNDVSIVTTRYDWVSGVVFAKWNDSLDMTSANFYCVTDDYRVYKCLDNSGGVASTVKPTSTSFYTFKTSDGYTWKYMYTIPVFKKNRFTALDYIPVQKSLTDSFYNKGGVDDVSVVNGGSGYSDANLTTISISGATVGSGAVGTLVVGGTGNILSVTMSNGGTGYISTNISFTTASGVGGKGTAVISGGVILSVTIDSAGAGYANGESVVFSVGGAVLVPSVSVSTGSITKINIISSGAGYSVAPTLTVVTGTTGSGKYGNATALLSAVVYQGRIVGVNILDPGILYPHDIATSIIVTGDGSDAAFSPVIYNSSIIDVIVENSGSGYTSMSLTVVGSGTGAVLTPIIAASDFISDQSIVEQTAIPGAIYSVHVTSGGTNYSSSCVGSVTGDGIGCTITPVIVNGSISKIIVDTPGSGYSYGTVTFTDPNRAISGTILEAEVYVILPPTGGHGFNAIDELYGTVLAINSSLRQDTIVNTLGQDYRQFGILKNPTNLISNSQFYDSSSLIAYKVTLNTVSGLVLDEILTQADNKFRVISVSGLNVVLQPLGVTPFSQSQSLIAETNNSRTYTTTAIISSPVVNKYSGKLIYVSNENPFSFTESQGIIIKTFLKF